MQPSPSYCLVLTVAKGNTQNEELVMEQFLRVTKTEGWKITQRFFSISDTIEKYMI